ncbi:MAG: beta-galactosidase [Prevotella sp.]|nr:beta-galactosidase [Prevotella sp.]
MKVLMDKYAEKPEATEWAPQGYKIKTRWAAEVNPQQPLPEYPRPQMVRDEWLNLNGLWDYAINTKRTIPTEWDGQILVPFPVESSLSGVMRMLDKNNFLWYQRTFTVPAEWQGREILLNFGAVDYQARVYVNGNAVGNHTGGFGAFSLNITPQLKEGENTITVMVIDNTDEATQPVGKQRYNPGGAGSIWYTQVSGIWQTVWLEPVNKAYISAITTTPDIDNSKMDITVLSGSATESDEVHVVLKLKGQKVAEGNGTTGSTIQLDVPNAKLWSPTNPWLYDLEVSLASGDRVKSYAAMRKISARKLDNGEWRMQLNNRDVFHFGLLDQGYWPDGLYTAPTDEALAFDVQKTKDWGFNMIRKHMKVEPARWYYHCDRLGLLVWQDMPALGRSDEPWVTREWSTKPGKHTTAVESAFKAQWKEIIEQLYSHPSIVVWTPFNESWGQFKTSEIVDFTRGIDNTRIINAASGGNHYAGVGDIVDLHDYDRPPHIFLYDANRPVVLGEFGGLGRHITDHRWYENNATTYVNYSTEKQLTDSYVQNVEAVATMAKDATAQDGGKAAFCAAVYTQTTDVETEVNGMMTYDREVMKMDETRVREANLKLTNIYGEEPKEDVDGIRNVGMYHAVPVTPAIYSLSGIQVDSMLSGINIIRKEDGTICKVYKK